MDDGRFKELYNFFHRSGETTVNTTSEQPEHGGKTQWIFGRGADCDFIYAGEKISRRHFMIEYIDSHYYVSDLNSTNGTYLNGRRLTRMERVFAGDIISMGSTDIVFSKQMLD